MIICGQGWGLSRQQKEAAIKRMEQMKMEDARDRQAAESKNTLERYLSHMSKIVNEELSWLAEHPGDDKYEYDRRLDEIQKQLRPLPPDVGGPQARRRGQELGGDL
jgi:molecular chaperone DnaK (HSP70)